MDSVVSSEKDYSDFILTDILNHSFYSIIEYYDLTIHGMVDAVYCGDSVADVDYLAGLTALGIEVEILYLALDNGDYVCCTDCAHRGHLLVNFLSSSRSFPS